MAASVPGLRADRDDPLRPDVLAFLTEHVTEMKRTSPPESVHALEPDALERAGAAFWTVREGGVVLGCGALVPLEANRGELKSMRTARNARGRGIAGVVLAAALEEARCRGYRSVLLETGTDPYFAPARRLYERHGFIPCAPFGPYREDPHSAYYALDLHPGMAGAPAGF